MEGFQRIAVFCPASPIDSKSLEIGISVLQDLGFSVRNFVSNEKLSPFERAYIFSELFTSGEFHALWAARGGFGSIELLPYLDELLKKPPVLTPLVVGFSDVTVLQIYLFSRFKLWSLHAPVLSLLNDTDPCAVFALKQVLKSRDRKIFLKGKPYSYGSLDSTVLVANLTSFASLCGTPYMPKDPVVLALEDTNESFYRLKRSFIQVLLSFGEKIKGLILGDLGEVSGLKLIESTLDFIPEGIPIGYDFPFGHGKRNFPVFSGVKSQLKITPYEASLYQSFSTN